ncbi:MAG TPA: iron ABC transporter permease [Beijerinckiaceae bacterium]|jgi:iron(III) transport system permease protein|nr:iron ABC transporter permease [Beijerinckiaceae bacterium]
MSELSVREGAGVEQTTRRPFRPDTGSLGLWLMIALAALIVLPPVFILVKTSLSIETDTLETSFGWDNFGSIVDIAGPKVWTDTLVFAAGSALIGLVGGVSYAWLVARTNAYFRTLAQISAFLSLSIPVIIKGIGWILLLGPNKGVLNEWLRALFGTSGVPIQLFGLGGMTFIEGILWIPLVFLLATPTLSLVNPALEEAAAMAGAKAPQILLRVTLPIAMPGLLAILLLTLLRSLESFDIPLLIGLPGGTHTVTTEIYETLHVGFVPHYGEASAFGVLLIGLLVLPLLAYYRVTRNADRFASITGKAFQMRRYDLGRWRLPAGLYLLLMPLSLLAPLAILLWASFLPIYESPSLSDFARMSLANYVTIFHLPLTVDGMWASATVSSLSATAVAAFTFLIAWIVVRSKQRPRYLLDFIGSLPLIIPGIVLGIAILEEFLAADFVPIYGTIWIIVFAFLVRFMPYGIRCCHAGIIAIHRELEESAATSGASPATILRRIVLPLAMPAVAAIWIYVFLNSIRDLSLPIMLAGPKSRLISVVILDRWQNGEVPQLAALSVILAATVSVLAWILMRLGQRYGAKSV